MCGGEGGRGALLRGPPEISDQVQLFDHDKCDEYAYIKYNFTEE